MINDLILHKRTLNEVNRMINKTPHSILIVGEEGSGKYCLAQNISATLLGLTSTDKLDDYPYLKVINPSEGKITIDQIRELKSLMNLKVPSEASTINRIALIIDADRLTTEAQNALLKTLEEPPVNTVLILTVKSERSLLDTIKSRAATLSIYPVSVDEIKAKINNIDQSNLNMAYSLSKGNVGQFMDIVNDRDSLLVENIRRAKELLSLAAENRMAMVENISKDKQSLFYLISAFKKIASAGLEASVKAGKVDQAKKWHNILKVSDAAYTDLNSNVSTKLVLDNLFFNL